MDEPKPEPQPDRTWRPYSAVAEVFDGPADPNWAVDRARLDEQIQDPFTRSARAPRAG